MRLSNGQRAKRSNEATPAITAKRVKNSVRLVISKPIKLFAGSVSLGSSVASLPAKILEAALLINQTPISNEAKRAGDNLFTIDKPIGDKQSSPIV